MLSRYNGEARSPIAAVLRAALFYLYPAWKIHRALRPSLTQGQLSLRKVRADTWHRPQPRPLDDLVPGVPVAAYAVCLCAFLALEPLADLFLRWVPLYEWIKLAAMVPMLVGGYALPRKVEEAILGPLLSGIVEWAKRAFLADGKVKPISQLAQEIGNRITAPPSRLQAVVEASTPDASGMQD